MNQLLKEATLSQVGSAAGPGDARKPHVVILGAGPAGLAAALSLARRSNTRVTVLERSEAVGGYAGSFLLQGIWCDHGSHRLHPVAEARVLDELKSLLGPDLLWRARHGRILLQNRWIHFPLKPIDLLLRLPKRFTATLALDTILKLLPRRQPLEANFGTVLQRGLGPTMCNSFYYPYARKLWGVAPERLAVTLAERRVSGSSVSRILRKVARQLPGLKSQKSAGFYYPRRGFGQISQSLCDAASAHGAEFRFGAEVTGITCENGRATGVLYEKDRETHQLAVDAVWSTVPINLLARIIEPSAPAKVVEATRTIRFRGMILIYLVLEQDQFSEYDAHYFPELSIPISRMSEPKNYSGCREPRNRTVLCAELPCDPDEAEWKLTDEELGRRLCGWLASVKLPVSAPVIKTITRRLRFAYPVYDQNYDVHFNTIADWLTGIDGLLTFGRQGLFAHDNTHHAMTMAFAAADCFGATGEFDKRRWSGYREEFRSHVVED